MIGEKEAGERAPPSKAGSGAADHVAPTMAVDHLVIQETLASRRGRRDVAAKVGRSPTWARGQYEE